MKLNKQKVTVVVAVLFFAAILAGAVWRYLPRQVQETQLGSEEVVQTLDEKGRNAALSYLEAVIQRAYTEGSNAALRQIVSLAQTAKEDGTVEPICQEVTIGDLHLVNVACLKKPEPPVFDLPNN